MKKFINKTDDFLKESLDGFGKFTIYHASFFWFFRYHSNSRGGIKGPYPPYTNLEYNFHIKLSRHETQETRCPDLNEGFR